MVQSYKRKGNFLCFLIFQSSIEPLIQDIDTESCFNPFTSRVKSQVIICETE